MPKIATKDWRNLPIEKWNTTTFHAYLIDRNRELYDVDYVPFGKGPISKRWSTEKGQIKQTINKHGNEAALAFIDSCFKGHRFNPKFPTLAFGFMYAYMRDNLTRAELEVRKSKKREDSAKQSEATEVDAEWF